ncbi:MAG: hypothetical protein ACI9S7_001012 [Candidatus Paceibacteria bacterium]|jgi:hypothetical protein
MLGICLQALVVFENFVGGQVPTKEKVVVSE